MTHVQGLEVFVLVDVNAGGKNKRRPRAGWNRRLDRQLPRNHLYPKL